MYVVIKKCFDIVSIVADVFMALRNVKILIISHLIPCFILYIMYYICIHFNKNMILFTMIATTKTNITPKKVKVTVVIMT